MKKLFSLFLVAAVLLTQQGCAVFMAVKQPARKDVSLFRIGTSRSLLIAEFGSPVTTEERDGKKYEIFKFTQGYSCPVKAGRALFHGAADVFTLGLWELIGTPTEMVFNGTEIAYEVSYDENNRIADIDLLKQGSTLESN